MAQTKHQIQALLAQVSGRPRRRFGQHFMIDGNLVRLVADAGQIQPGDLTIEIGPGTGTLTEELLARGADVLAVEIDSDLADLLQRRFAAPAQFRLIRGDALAAKHALNAELLAQIVAAKSRNRTVRLVANLPYNVAAPLVIESLIAGVDVLSFTVQKEVADRLRAAPGSDDYGPLSIVAQLLSRVELLRKLPPEAFWPRPKVHSALVRLTRDDQLHDRATALGAFVHRLFSARRKMLKKALTLAGADAERVLAATRTAGDIRPEELSPAQCLELFTAAAPDKHPGL
jgi:16S rRNA (adenine1518-N6/adenine1519-N6)-dimethyltransferase